VSQRRLEGGLSRTARRTLGSTLCPTSSDYALRAGAELALTDAQLMMRSCEVFVQKHDGLLTGSK
jgi:hypothetical protein